MSLKNPREDGDLLAAPIARAVLVTVRERGYAGARVEEFLERSGMTRGDFDRRFSGKEEVVLVVLDAHLAHFEDRVGRAYDAVEGWPDNLRAAAYETARYILENPELTWFMVSGASEADQAVRARRDRLFAWAAGLFDAGRGLAEDPASVPAAAPLVAIGTLVEALRRRQSEPLEVGVARNLPWLMYAAVKPYLGEEAARAELSIELPPDLWPT